MKLTYFRGLAPNFGDELNVTIWDRVLPPGFLDEDESELFVGIGSILGSHHPRKPRKYVVGTGFGGYQPPAEIHDGSWDVVFVRGPLTAERLNLPAEKAISDGAILIRLIDLPRPAKSIKVAYMPHFESLDRGGWDEVCRLAGIRLIDPTKPVAEVLTDILAAELLITEAMHGAIVADALRTPWVAVKPIESDHHMKWLDWSESLGLELRRQPLFPSSVLELYVSGTKRKALPGGHARRWAQTRFAKAANKPLAYYAAMRLAGLAKVEPQLSSDANIARATDRAAAALDSFVRLRGRQPVAAK